MNRDGEGFKLRRFEKGKGMEWSGFETWKLDTDSTTALILMLHVDGGAFAISFSVFFYLFFSVILSLTL